MITKISFYDFDGTLCDSPTPETGKAIWLSKTGTPYPHVGWWGREESLDERVFSISLIPSVKERVMADRAQESTRVVLLTSRLAKLAPVVKNILHKRGIYLDEYLTKNDSREKDQRILDYLNEYPSVEIIDVYDDRDKEILLFNQMLPLMVELGISFNIYQIMPSGNITHVNGPKIRPYESDFLNQGGE